MEEYLLLVQAIKHYLCAHLNVYDDSEIVQSKEMSIINGISLLLLIRVGENLLRDGNLPSWTTGCLDVPNQ